MLVIQGYLDMMSKGMTGDLTPTMKRYVERMQSATQDMAVLIARQLARGREDTRGPGTGQDLGDGVRGKGEIFLPSFEKRKNSSSGATIGFQPLSSYSSSTFFST